MSDGRKRKFILKGFSKLIKEDKLKIVAEMMDNQVETVELLKSFGIRILTNKRFLMSLARTPSRIFISHTE